MHHVIGYHLAQAHIAGLSHDAQCDTLARAVLACALRCCADRGPFLAPPRPLGPPGPATQPLAESAPPLA